jgi:hypothetical protein
VYVNGFAHKEMKFAQNKMGEKPETILYWKGGRENSAAQNYCESWPLYLMQSMPAASHIQSFTGLFVVK